MGGGVYDAVMAESTRHVVIVLTERDATELLDIVRGKFGGDERARNSFLRKAQYALANLDNNEGPELHVTDGSKLYTTYEISMDKAVRVLEAVRS